MNLNGRTSNPGDLRNRITLQSRTITSEDGGFQHPAWTTIADVWAKWSNVHGSEAWTAASLQAEQAATVVIRYRSDVNVRCAVLKGSTRYEIVSIDDIQERHEYLELKVKRMTAG